jgi:hypothetical protein
MSKGVGSGDKLARGGVRADFATTDGGVSADKWAQAFDDFDLEAFNAKPNRTEVSGDDASLSQTGDVGFNAPEAAE